MNKKELNTLEILDVIIRRESVRTLIDSIIPRVERKLNQNGKALMAWKPVALAVYGNELPDMIRSSWGFVLRAQVNTGAERHPNSHQYMISYRCSGDLQIWAGERWCSNILVSDPEARIENRCISILPNIWHQAVVLKDNWVVVSFHTVPEDKLIEERSDLTDPKLTHQRLYLDK